VAVKDLINAFASRDHQKISELKYALTNPSVPDVEKALIRLAEHETVKDTFHLLVLVLKELGFGEYAKLKREEINRLYLYLRNFKKGLLIKKLSKAFPHRPLEREQAFYVLFLSALKYLFVDVPLDKRLYSKIANYDPTYAEELLKTPEIRDIF